MDATVFLPRIRPSSASKFAALLRPLLLEIFKMPALLLPKVTVLFVLVNPAKELNTFCPRLTSSTTTVSAVLSTEKLFV
jgi:hypothetical protein